MVRLWYSTLLAVAVAASLSPAAHAQAKSDAQVLARGKYIVQVGGCNDCHTAGYAQAGGDLPEKDWLKGDNVGWHGAWGTTYPINLRTFINDMSQEQWLTYARNMKARPPMPWFAVQAMSDDDLVALHTYVKSLGRAGEAAPAYLPPGQAPKMPYIQFPQ